jgi:hypothetical protein
MTSLDFVLVVFYYISVCVQLLLFCCTAMVDLFCLCSVTFVLSHCNLLDHVLADAVLLDCVQVNCVSSMSRLWYVHSW